MGGGGAKFMGRGGRGVVATLSSQGGPVPKVVTGFGILLQAAASVCPS